MSKGATRKSIIPITMLIFSIFLIYLFNTMTSYNSITERIVMSLVAAFMGCVGGAITGFILYLIVRGDRTTNLLKQQNEILLDMKKKTKSSQLSELCELKEKGIITEEEFNKLKSDIIDKN